MSAERGTLLLVDDEAYVRDSLARVLRRRGFVVRTAASAPEALTAENLAGADAAITDLRMPGADGLALLTELLAREPGLPVVVLTGHGTVPSAVECMKAGAFDYLLKPADPEELVLILERALTEAGRRRELDYLRRRDRQGTPSRRPLGESRGWLRAIELAEAAAPHPTPVLLLGETGVGKEVLARYIHEASPRRGEAFVTVNCAAVPAELFESEFFGHRRGAFTGAVADREGRFRVAHRGTLFLDEINSLPLPAQAKVLRVLENGHFERVGESRSTTVDVRLLCASNADLATEVEAGRFREDLLYRIAVFTVPIPPLRERPEDLPILARAFLRELAGRLGKEVRELAPETLERLTAWSWPGNVRELRNVLERGVLLEQGERLRPESLPFHLREEGRTHPAGGPAAGADLNLRDTLAATEKSLLREALERAGGVRREAARLLGVDERNLAYFLKKHGLMERFKG